ncbi:putative F-box domain-containing protein [Helianthus annuus]|nr:putative F-box domain-containing protein [Helianthus annuus]
MTSQTLRQCGITAPIDVISEDLLQNIVARLPATSFASAACVSRSWNVVCDRVLSRPKFASACSLNRSLEVTFTTLTFTLIINYTQNRNILPILALILIRML